MSYRIDPDSLNLASLSDVSGAPSDGETLSYDGSWAGAEIAGDRIAFAFRATSSWLTQGGSTSYSYRVNVDAGDRPPYDIMQCAYSVADIYKRAGLTQYNWGLYESWYSSAAPRLSGVFLPPGTWLCRSTFGGRRIVSPGSATVQWFTGGAVGVKPTVASMNPVGPKFYVAQSEGRFCQIPTAVITTTNPTTLVGLQTLEATNFQYGYAYYWIKHMSFHITQLG